MPIQIISPHRYKERICVFGAEGTGKSSLTLNALRYDTEAVGWVVDIDYSYAYDRLISSEYPDLEGRVNVFTIEPEFDQLGETLDRIMEQANPEKDWLTIDPATHTWQMVQNWYSDKVHGVDLSDHLLSLRKKSQDARNSAANDKEVDDAKKGYGRDVVEDMSWPLINKLYQQGFYKRLHQWHGHYVLVCEADAVRKDASEEDRATYGFLGFRPKGQKAMPYVAATNMYLDHPGREKWRMSTVKDRGRTLVEKMEFDNFALDYLVDIGGWERQVVRKGAE